MVFCYLLSVRPGIYVGFGFIECVQTRKIKPLSIRLLIDNQLVNQLLITLLSCLHLIYPIPINTFYSSKTKLKQSGRWVNILFENNQIESSTV